MGPVADPDLSADDTGAAAEPHGRIAVVGNVIGSSIVVGNGNTVTVICAAEVGRRQTLDENPYRGLDAFDERSHDLFFGRERIVSELLDRMKRLVSRRGNGGPARLLAILGPSGCGKSSIARAGLVPALASYSADAPELWGARVIIARPGYDPVDALAGALARSVTGEPNSLSEKRQFAAVLREAARLGRCRPRRADLVGRTEPCGSAQLGFAGRDRPWAAWHDPATSLGRKHGQHGKLEPCREPILR